MKINVNDNRSTMNFGMAYYCASEKKLKDILGTKAAAEVEEARPLMSKLAEDCDIYLEGQNSKNKDLRLNKIIITVCDKETNPIKRLLGIKSLNLSESIDTYTQISLKAAVLNKTENLVKTFKQYR